MDKQALREAAQEMVKEISTVLVEAIKTGAEQTRIELVQVRAEMRDDAMTEALERLAERRETLQDKIKGAKSPALKAALKHQLGLVDIQEAELLGVMGVEEPEGGKAEMENARPNIPVKRISLNGNS